MKTGQPTDGPTLALTLNNEGSGTRYVAFAVYRKDRYGDLDQIAGESVEVVQIDTSGKPEISISAPAFIDASYSGLLARPCQQASFIVSASYAGSYGARHGCSIGSPRALGRRQ